MVIEVVVVLVQFIFSLLAIKITRFTIIFPIALHSRLFIYTHTHTNNLILPLFFLYYIFYYIFTIPHMYLLSIVYLTIY